MSHFRRLTVGISSIRGIVGERLQPVLAADFASSFGGFLGKGTVIVARDTRQSGIMLEQAVISGLIAAGCKVISAGIIPTPTVQLAVKQHEYTGAIMISASQHPKEWNALKFINQNGMYLSESEMETLFDIYNQPEDGFLKENLFHPVLKEKSFFEEHSEKILQKIDTGAIRSANLKIAVDCGNGVGAIYTRRFLLNLGVKEVFLLNETPDGNFPESNRDLSECIVANGCHAGFIQDPDGDNITLLDESGNQLDDQKSILIPCIRILERTPGNISASIQTTAALNDLVRNAGGKIFYTRIGEACISRSVLKNETVLGVEGGGIIWKEIHPCRDSFAAMALTLEKLALSGQKTSQIIKSVPIYFSAERSLKCNAKSAEAALRNLEKKFSSFQPELIDGVRIEMENSWVLVRKSSSESALRIYTESGKSGENAEEIAEDFKNELQNFLV